MRSEDPSDQTPLAFAQASTILQALARRTSCRDFDQRRIARSEIEAMLSDAIQAPSSCNQQHWHFVVVDDPYQLARAADLAGGNPHFRTCAALVYLCFQKGWTHDNFSVVQGVAAAAYHLMLSAHLRGYGAVWNAGTGDPTAVRQLLKLPAIFESQGAIAIGRPTPDAPMRKPPRRPLSSVISYQEFARDPVTIYPAQPADSYPFASISRVENPYAEWDPTRWSWDQIADYRAWSVWAKSPLAGVYTSRRQGEATARELDLLSDLPVNARVLEVMAWAGTSTVALARRLPDDARLEVAELHDHNITFIADRLAHEGITRPVDLLRMTGPALPLADAVIDAVVIPQVLEHMPDPAALLAEVRRVLKPNGRVVISARNRTSRYGAIWARQESRGQVPLQGPFTPLRARALLKLIDREFTIERLAGIGLNAAEDSGTADQGIWRMRRRIIAVQARPR